MSIDVAWLRVGSVIWVRLSDSVMLEEIAQIQAGIDCLLADTTPDQTFTIVLDAMNLTDYPRDVVQLHKMLKGRQSDPRIKTTLYLTDDYYQRHIIDLVSRIMRKRVRTFDTYAQVVHFLNMPEEANFPPETR